MRATRGISRGPAGAIVVDGRPTAMFDGETVATVLLAAGVRRFGRAADGSPRGPYCNMGVCYECLVDLAATPGEPMVRLRACLTPARTGMIVATAETAGGGVDDGVD